MAQVIGPEPTVDNLARHLDYRPDVTEAERDEVFNTVDSFDPKDSILSHYVLEEAYDISQGIYKGYTNDGIVRPYAIVAYHPMEERLDGTLLDRWVKKFADYSIRETIGVTFGEFVQMDMESIICIYNTAVKMSKVKRDALSEQAKALSH